MIELTTGTPGACKTLSAVERLSKMQARWEKHPDEARAVFVHGVKDLALPHSPLPVMEVPNPRSPRLAPIIVPDWSAVPAGSFCLIDEAQSFFPPRASGADVPEHVAFLNTHRHQGLDILVITQHPKLIDSAVRALVGKHQHYRRLFGGQRSIVYEWDACSDNLAGLKTAVTSYYAFPKRAFSWYKSAEVHTKQSFRIPRWVIVPFLGLAIGAFAVPMAISRIAQMGSGASASQAVASVKPEAIGAGAFAHAPVAASPASVPSPVEPAASEPEIAGCMAMAGRCTCVQSDGKVVDAPQLCEVSARGFGYLVKLNMKPSAPVERVQKTAVAEPAQAGAVGFSAGDFRQRERVTR